MFHRHARLLLALLVMLLAVPASATDVPAPIAVEDGVVVWTLEAEYAATLLTVHAPAGAELRRSFATGDAVRLDPAGELSLDDGVYEYQLVLVTDEVVGEGRRALRQSGAFEVRGGAAVESAFMDQTFADDVIVQGSLCVGTDCNTGENFGFDTLRLKENNLRIHFDDTSSSASFPSNDWGIEINDSNNGGASYFGILDRTAGRRVFSIEAGAPANSVYVDDAGNLGLGEATPTLELHMADGDTPSIRLEQDGSSGFTPQTWDVAGNEAGFFVRDVTNGGRLSFRILPNSPADFVVVKPTGLTVGRGTSTSAKADLDVAGIGNFTRRLLVGYSDTADASSATFQVASGQARFDQARFDGQANFFAEADFREAITGRDVLNFSGDYSGATGFVFRIRDTSQGGNPSLLELENNGDLAILGSLSQSSDVNRKENVVAVDAEAVLEGVAGLDIATWNYISNDDAVVHMGPMAQDFWRTFGLGRGETTISTIDADGVSLAAIQALHARTEAASDRIESLEAENARLAAQNAALAERLARLEALLADRD